LPASKRARFRRGSHSGKALASVLEHYPRDELFQIDEDTLYRFALAILQLDERPRVRVLARHDRFDVSCRCWSMFRANAMTANSRQDRRISRQRISRPRFGILSIFSGRALCACTSSSANPAVFR